ncbi:unnamed protein product [Paramecium pentaurelia]|uniref:Uncharacterized protein n=1 Tax=Paramecium pentaurelia TaxID=43138 RepID=A0A8S1T1G3_9CILI|nr:unnamed protein product [Paramecium pentaurelia]
MIFLITLLYFFLTSSIDIKSIKQYKRLKRYKYFFQLLTFSVPNNHLTTLIIVKLKLNLNCNILQIINIDKSLSLSTQLFQESELYNNCYLQDDFHEINQFIYKIFLNNSQIIKNLILQLNTSTNQILNLNQFTKQLPKNYGQCFGHSNNVRSVCFSPDGNTLASGSRNNSIRLWDVQNGKEIQSADKKYKDILAKFKAPLFSNNPLPESNNITILRISQTPLFQAQGALILKGEFINYEGYDLKPLFKSKGSCFLEDLKQK